MHTSHRPPQSMRAGALTVVICLAGVAGGAGCSAPGRQIAGHKTRPVGRRALPDSRPRPTPDPTVRRRVVLGRSRQGRPVVALHSGDPDSARRVLVVGCIHGNEPAGIAIARAVAASPPPAEVDLWVVTDLNPDGVAQDTRGNAGGVDLNRNFRYRWRGLGRVGSPFYSGARPLSEPESRIATALIRRVRPTLGIWYHQPLGVVDVSQGPLSLERDYAAEAGLPVRRLADYPGSAVGWEDHRFGPTAFVVELPGGRLSSARVHRHVHAALDIAAHSASVGSG